MLRNTVVSVSLLCLIALCAVTMNCGSSYSSSNGGGNCKGGPFNVVGDWTLTLTGGSGSVSGPGVINSTGLAVFFQTTTTVPAPGDTAVFPAITGSSCFSGTGTSYGTPFSGGGTASDTVTGTVNSNTSIAGTLSNGNSFTIASDSPLTGPVTALQGSYLGEIEGDGTAQIWQLTFAASGNGNTMNFFGGNGATCTVSGTFSQEGSNVSNLNVFDVTMTFTGVGCPDASGNGVGFESSTDYFTLNANAPGTYLYSVSSSAALVFEIFLPSIGVDAPSPQVVRPRRRGSPWSGIF
jgi:hypothetical protein